MNWNSSFLNTAEQVRPPRHELPHSPKENFETSWYDASTEWAFVGIGKRERDYSASKADRGIPACLMMLASVPRFSSS